MTITSVTLARFVRLSNTRGLKFKYEGQELGVEGAILIGKKRSSQVQVRIKWQYRQWIQCEECGLQDFISDSDPIMNET